MIATSNVGIMTAGITNIPLTKPAFLFFVCKEREHFAKVKVLYESLRIPFTITWHKGGTIAHFSSVDELPAVLIKQVWRNFKTLHPRFKTEWRYLFYEIDNKDNEIILSIINVYKRLNLPVYVHETMRGFHFISLIPISKEVFKEAVTGLRVFNERYPPITLRIIPNKHDNEAEIYSHGFIVAEKYHYDTERFMRLMQKQDIETLAQNYQVVWYRI